MENMSESAKEFHVRKNRLSRLLGPYERWIVKCQDCFSFDSPIITVSSLCVIHYVVWSISTYGLRLFFVMPSIALGLLLLDTWRNQIWPEIRVPPEYEDDTEDWTPVHLRVLSVPEISWHVAKVWCWSTKKFRCCKQVRSESPFLFVIYSVLFLSVIGIFGCYISGLTLSYLLVMSLYAWSAVQYLQLDQLAWDKSAMMRERIVAALPAFTRSEKAGGGGLDEFLPVENLADAQRVLSDALQEDDLETRMSEERLLPGGTAVTDFWSPDTSALLELGLPSGSTFPSADDDLTDDELDRDILPEDDLMNFHPTHFNGGGEESSDAGNYKLVSGLATSLQSLGHQVVTAATAAAEQYYRNDNAKKPTSPHPQNDDDNEDFVFLDTPGEDD